MILILTKETGTLAFKTCKSNDKDDVTTTDHGVAFDGIDVNKNYRMAVTMWDKKNSVQIVK